MSMRSKSVVAILMLGLLGIACVAPVSIVGSPPFVIFIRAQAEDLGGSLENALITAIRKDGSIFRLGATRTTGALELERKDLENSVAIVVSKDGYGDSIWRPSSDDLTNANEIRIALLAPVALAEVSPKADGSRPGPLAKKSALEARPGASSDELVCVIRGLGFLDRDFKSSALLLLPGAEVWMVRRDGQIVTLGRADEAGSITLKKSLLKDGLFLAANAEGFFAGGWQIEPEMLERAGELNISLAIFIS